jgi:hypothetical protein
MLFGGGGEAVSKSMACSSAANSSECPQIRTRPNSAAQIRERDPEMAMAVAYDAARKAMVALLETQVLRPTSQGRHIALREAVDAQLGGLPGAQPLQPSTGCGGDETPSST